MACKTEQIYNSTTQEVLETERHCAETDTCKNECSEMAGGVTRCEMCCYSDMCNAFNDTMKTINQANTLTQKAMSIISISITILAFVVWKIIVEMSNCEDYKCYPLTDIKNKCINVNCEL